MFLLCGCGRKVLRNDTRKVCDGHFRLLDFGMPSLLPFERVAARKARVGEQFHLALNRHIAAACGLSTWRQTEDLFLILKSQAKRGGVGAGLTYPQASA